MESLELIKLLLDGGFSAVVIYLVLDMRREARESRADIWALVMYLVKRDDPDADIQTIVTEHRK